MWRHFLPIWFCFMQVDSKIKFPISSYLNKCWTWLTKCARNSLGNYLQYIQFIILSISIICVNHYNSFDLFTHVTIRCISMWDSTCNLRVHTYNVSGDEMGIQMTYNYYENKMNDKDNQYMRRGHRWYTGKMSSMNIGSFSFSAKKKVSTFNKNKYKRLNLFPI